MITTALKHLKFRHKTAPYKHQEEILETTWKRKYYALFWEMGAAKTKPTLDTAAKLFLAGEIDGLLIISDNGAYRNWVDYEIPQHWPEEIPIRTAIWSSQMCAKDRDRCNQLLVAKDDVLDILAINVEAFSSKQAPIFAEAFIRAHYAMVVIDESTSIKNIKSARTKAIIELGQLAEYRRILDGTPVTNGPLDLYSQFEFLEPKCLDFDNFITFRAFFAKLMLMDMGKGRKFYQITGYQNLDHLSKIIKPLSSRILKKDCLDLPEKIYERINISHTPEQEELYNRLRDEAIIMLEDGSITAVSAITMLVKLHQINCGHVKDDDGTTRDIPNNRVSGLVELLEKISAKTIIWAHFNRDIEMIMEALREKFGMWSCVDYYGPTSAEDRIKAIQRFRTDPNCMFFVSSQATGGRGITLVEASHSVYYSQSFNLAHRLQSEDRNHRPGQRSNVTYTDLVVPRTVDVKIVNALRQKKDLASEILDVYRMILDF